MRQALFAIILIFVAGCSNKVGNECPAAKGWKKIPTERSYGPPHTDFEWWVIKKTGSDRFEFNDKIVSEGKAVEWLSPVPSSLPSPIILLSFDDASNCGERKRIQRLFGTAAGCEASGECFIGTLDEWEKYHGHPDVYRELDQRMSHPDS